ncbi:MAG TPA: phage portal protein [Vicinamibacterales bacterium]|nr:phage portal protein [Vicinamibacterales bacterium]
MRIGPFTIARTKALGIQLQPLSGRGGWWNIIREPFMGAWQRNQEVAMDTVLTYSAVFACVTLIAADIGKLCIRLVKQNEDGIWTETESAAFSPVLRKPNRYQTRVKFVEQWIVSKLVHGNTYVLKQRDNRRIVTALYILDPTRVTPLVAQDGSIYYELKRDDISGIPQDVVTVPASEIIHDTMVSLYHPLIGVSPLYACGAAAMQGLAIQSNSTKLFSNGSNPGGVLTAPGAISDTTAQRLKAYWDENYTGDNVGKVAVLGDGLKYEQMALNAVDAQLIEQLKWTGETVCTCFHVPAYMVGIGPPPPYANIEPLIQQYYAQCLQSLTTSMEVCLDEGLGLLGKIDGTQYGVEVDVDDLYWMDVAARNKAAADSIGSGGMSPDEARQRYFGLGKVAGGDTPYLQQQYWPLKQLAERTIPALPAATTAPPASNQATDDDVMDMAATLVAIRRKAQERWGCAA